MRARSQQWKPNRYLALFESTGIEVQDKRILLSALQNFAQTDVNFADAYHAAVACAESIAIVSFDRDFDQFPGIKRIEPQSSHQI